MNTVIEKPDALSEKLAEMGIPDDAVIFVSPSYVDAIIGYELRTGKVIYDYDKMVECLVKEGMSHEDAVEWIDYNALGTYCGENTPIVMQATY